MSENAKIIALLVCRLSFLILIAIIMVNKFYLGDTLYPVLAICTIALQIAFELTGGKKLSQMIQRQRDEFLPKPSSDISSNIERYREYERLKDQNKKWFQFWL